MLTGITGASPEPRLVDSIARRSDGNAFFAEELAAAASEPSRARDRLPETLRDVLLVRLSAASPSTGRVAEIASVAGQHIDHDILAQVCGLPEDELGAALREAVEAQLLVVDADEDAERYRFRHALAQEAAYEQLAAVRASTPARRVRRGDGHASGGGWRRGGQPARRDRPPLDRRPPTRSGARGVDRGR